MESANVSLPAWNAGVLPHVGSVCNCWGVNIDQSAPEQFRFGNRTVFPSYFEKAGFGFEGGTTAFEVLSMWVLGTELSSLHHHSLHTCLQSVVPLKEQCDFPRGEYGAEQASHSLYQIAMVLLGLGKGSRPGRVTCVVVEEADVAVLLRCNGDG